MLEQGHRCLAIEVKLTTTPRYRDTENLRRFLQVSQAVGGVLIYTGQEIRRLDERIVALPWTVLTG